MKVDTSKTAHQAQLHTGADADAGRGGAMKTLRLNLKRKWWDQINEGSKKVELRLATDYWRKRLIRRRYSAIHLCLGYPKAGDELRVIKRRWRGVKLETITHEEFGPDPVEVFVIDVSTPVEQLMLEDQLNNINQ